MKVNALPAYDMSDNPTGCCPRFNSEGWDETELHFEDKLFVRATTRSFFHVPINMGRVFTKVFAAIEAADAQSDTNIAVLSRDLSPWTAEHLFAVTKDVPGQEMTRLSGNYVTKVFEGAYRQAPVWDEAIRSHIRSLGKVPGKTFAFFTTCPRCAKTYGKNYVVMFGEARTSPASA